MLSVVGKLYAGILEDRVCRVTMVLIDDEQGALEKGIKSMYVESSVTVMKEVKMKLVRRGVSFMEDGREWRLPGLLYADDLALCGKSEGDLRVMEGWFAEVCRRRRLKVNASKSKVMVLNGEEGLVCEVHVDRIRLEHVSVFKYLGWFGRIRE